MAYNAATALDQISESQSGKAATANSIFNALSAGALWGIKSSLTSGLSFTLQGGNMYIAGVPTAIATQTVTLSDNTTNYIYATSAGVVTKTTSIPAGWPGPLASSAIALYKIVTASGLIVPATSDCHVLSMGSPGTAGVQGEQGPAGTDFSETRMGIWTVPGAGATTVNTLGLGTMTVVGTATARSLASSSLRESIPYVAYLSSASAGTSAQIHPNRDWCYTGNAAGRGGFTLGMRFCLENALSPATARSFFGLFAQTTLGNVEPDTFVNIIGIGAKASEASFSWLYNDASGTATKTLINSNDSPTVNFPARATDNVYELTLTSVANSQSISAQLDNINAGTRATTTINSNIPANTQFLSWVAWVNNGSTASQVAVGLMQVISQTRY